MGEIISSRCPILNSMWKILAALKVICPVSWNFLCILVLYNCKICLKRREQYGKSCQKALKRTLKEGRGGVYCRQAVVTAMAMEEKG